MRETYVAKKQYSNLREILIKNIPNIDILNLEIKIHSTLKNILGYFFGFV